MFADPKLAPSLWRAAYHWLFKFKRHLLFDLHFTSWHWAHTQHSALIKEGPGSLTPGPLTIGSWGVKCGMCCRDLWPLQDALGMPARPWAPGPFSFPASDLRESMRTVQLSPVSTIKQDVDPGIIGRSTWTATSVLIVRNELSKYSSATLAAITKEEVTWGALTRKDAQVVLLTENKKRVRKHTCLCGSSLEGYTDCYQCFHLGIATWTKGWIVFCHSVQFCAIWKRRLCVLYACITLFFFFQILNFLFCIGA